MADSNNNKKGRLVCGFSATHYGMDHPKDIIHSGLGSLGPRDLDVAVSAIAENAHLIDGVFYEGFSRDFVDDLKKNE